MLTAYYSRGCDSEELFAGRKAMEEDSFRTHLNQHNVIRLDIQRFLFEESHLGIFIDKIQKSVIQELKTDYGQFFQADQYGLPGVLGQIYARTKQGFIFIIDEWDCVFRFAKERGEILPIKKYGEHSALNIFDGYP